MRLVRLPDGVVTDAASARALYDRLSTEHRVEVGTAWFHGAPLVRFSGQVYNTENDYDRLADALVRTCGQPC